MNDVKRVLLVFGKLNRGGAETMAMNLYRNIDRSRLQFDFVAHTEEHCDFDDEIKALGGRIYRMPRYNIKNHRVYKRCWEDFFQKHSEYKIVHAHMSGSAAVFLPIAKKHGCYVISHSHTVAPKNGLRQFIVNSYRFPLRYVSDYMFACSDQAGQWMFGKNAVNSKNYSVLKNGIDLEKFAFSQAKRDAVRAEFHIGADTFAAGNVGRMDASKNQSYLIDIFKEIHAKNSNSVLLLIGDGVNRKTLEQKVKDNDLQSSVIFTGVRSDVDCLMSAMDVFVLPSLYEGLPVSMIEAQAAGLPSFATAAISPEVQITDLAELCSIDAPASTWADMVLRHSDRHLRADKSSEIRKAGYDIKQSAAWLQNFYLNILENKK